MHTQVLFVPSLLLCGLLPAQNGIQLTTGIDGGVELPYDPLFAPPTGITVEAWITYDDSTIPTGLYYWPTIARHNIGNAQEVWNFRVGASNNGNRSLDFIVRQPLGTLQSVGYPFAQGELLPLTHVAATYDGQVLKLFKNGVEVATRTLTTANEIPSNPGVLRIGNADPVNPGFEAWNGIIDEFRLWPMARTAAEIQATMNQSLSAVAGKVLGFTFDNHYVEVNHGLIGTPFGTITFAPGATLSYVTATALSVGQSTTTCGRSIDSLLGSMPQVGNAAFAIWCTRGPRPASSPLGLVVAAGAAAPASQPPFFGVQLAFDLSTFLAEAALVPPTGVLGNARFGLPIPNVPLFVGTGFVFQYGFVHAQCGPQGFSASDGIAFTIQ
jgi:hypothetical protein